MMTLSNKRCFKCQNRFFVVSYFVISKKHY